MLIRRRSLGTPFRASQSPQPPRSSPAFPLRERAGIATGAMLALGVTAGSADVARAALSFVKVTDASNPIVVEPGGTGGKYYGTSWVDYDGDGDVDLFRDPTFLYRNDGGGTFVKITTSGIGSETVTTGNFSMEGSSWADTDNDGDPDAFLAGEVGVFYRNEGGTFPAVLEGGIGDVSGNRGWACAWADYDNDGWVDLVVAHPAFFIPGDPLPNHLFHNDGPPGWNFTRVPGEPISDGLAPYTVATWADYDDDGDQDLFIGSGPANGTVAPDFLFRNLLTETGEAHFERITDAPIATDLQDGQVWNWIDYDNDGDLDAYLTNYAGTVGGMPNRLYRQESDGTFTRITGQPIVTDPGPYLASVWSDFDNDGDLDCFAATDGGLPDRLYENDGDGSFTPRLDTPLTALGFATRGATAGDYDGDGDQDLYVYAPLANAALYQNTTAGNHWAELTLVGTISNRSAIGARVRAKATMAGIPTWQRRDVSAQNTFQGQNDLRAHFGLRDATRIDSLEVRWPSGIVQVLENIAADQFVTIIEPASAGAGDEGIDPWGGGIVASWPEPFTNAVALRTALPAGLTGTLSFHDATGRELRRLSVRGGEHVVIWDGKDERGAPVASGIYWTRLESGGRTDRERLVRIR